MAINPAKFNITGALARLAGAAGVGIVAMDSHQAAKTYAHRYETKKTTDNLEERYFDTLTLNTPSAVKNTVKKKILFFDMDNNLDSFFYSISGYVKGLGEMMLDNVVPLALSLGALLGPKKFVSKTCGLGLLTYGLGFLAQEFFRIGK